MAGRLGAQRLLGPGLQQRAARARELASRWVGQQGFRQGDQLELLLDCDEGKLQVKKNGRLLGAAVASRGALPVWEELCWAVVGGEGDAIRIQSTDPQLF